MQLQSMKYKAQAVRRAVLGAISENERLRGFVSERPGVWNKRRQFQIEFLIANGLQPHHTVLDIGCGPLAAGIPLIEYLQPGNYVGVDIRPKAIAEAHVQVAKHGLAAKNPLLVVTDSFGREELGERTFDVIWAFAVLYHLDDSLVGAFFNEASQRLKSTGRMFLTVNTQNTPGLWQEFPYVKRPLDFYRNFGTGQELDMEVLGQLETLGYDLPKAGGRNDHMLMFHKEGVQGESLAHTG